MNLEKLPTLLTVKETAEYLRIPIPTVYYLVQRGQLPAIQIGGRWRIKRELLDRDILHAESPSTISALVVDSDPNTGALFESFLEQAGIDGVIVGSGAEAVAAMDLMIYSLIFVEMRLPDMPGDELYAKIKKRCPNVPIVVITGHPDSEAMSKVLTNGPVTVLKKPIQFEKLPDAVQPFITETASVA